MSDVRRGDRKVLMDRVRHIARATTIQSPTTFTFAGQSFATDKASPAPAGVLSATSAVAAPLIPLLTETLYSRCYCSRFDDGGDSPSVERGAALPHARPRWGVSGITESPEAAAAFQRTLAEANAGVEAWDLGWRVREALPGGQVVATKGDWLRTFQPGEYLSAGAPGIPPMAGGALRILLTRDSWTTQPGFYYAFGTTITDGEDDRDIIRVYWNVRADGSAPLVRSLSSTLNRYTIPFRFKCQVHPAAYGRIDGTVLFIARRYYALVSEVLRGVYDDVARNLDDDVPLFTFRLQPGLSVAEDPGTGESFGMHRMRLVAEGLWASFAAGRVDAESKLRAIGAALQSGGVSLESPHLKPGSRHDFGH